MPKKLKRYYGEGHLHFITCSCYRRLPVLGAKSARNEFVKIFGEVRRVARTSVLRMGILVCFLPKRLHSRRVP